MSAIFEAFDDTSGLEADFNVAPTDPVPVVRMSKRRSARVLDTARWGLVPPWADNPRAGARMINARSETVATSRAFAASFARRRCLVPADGWFEWVRAGREKQAYYMTPTDGSVLAFAGLWSAWGDGDEPLITCSILTMEALGPLRRVHDRMPLILSQSRWESWLAGGGGPESLLQAPALQELAKIEIRPVGAAVGNVRNNGADLVAAVAPTMIKDHLSVPDGRDDERVGFPTESTLF